MYDLHTLYLLLQDRTSLLFQAEQEMIRCLYRKMEQAKAAEAPLFSMWQNELTFTYGDLNALLSQNAKIDPRELRGLYGFEDAEAVDLSQLLKCIQTFYSVLMKLIACNMVRGAVPSAGAEPAPSIREILSGEAFTACGIRNYCYEDWFSWILKHWDPDIELHCRRLLACLEDADTILSVQAFLQAFRPDSLNHIYETVIPKEIRHALGEYYTPDWLAVCGIKNALRASGQRVAELRFMDPTCGAGTFLTNVLRMVRKEAPHSPVSPSAAVGFDINALAVLTAKTNYLAALMDQIGSCADLVIPIYHYDVINTPVLAGDTLTIDTDCDLICKIPVGICEQVIRQIPRFRADDFLCLLRQSSDCGALWRDLARYDPVNQKIIANILLNRIFAFYEKRADLVVGNPPWVNWEYLPQEYKRKAQHLWQEYGLIAAKGPDLSFLKEDISVLITCIVIHRFLREHGCLSFVLRQAMFQSAQNGAGFRHFQLKKDGICFRVLQVDDLCAIRPFDGVGTRSALVLIRKNEPHTFPVPYLCWKKKRGFAKAARGPDAADAVMAHVSVERMSAFPADGQDPSSVWIHAPESTLPVIRTLLGSNPYQARTGVFTGGANAVYWLDLLSKAGNTVTVRNIVQRAKRKVSAVTAEIEPDYVYPLVQGSDLSQWKVRSGSYILCPHTAETKLYPVAEEVLQAAAPRTLAYLTEFRDDLNARRGFAGWEREIQAQHFYAVLRVGAYTFSKYKVAWRYIARSFITAVITSAQDRFLGEKLYIPNEKIMFVGTDSRQEAYYLCGVLSSSPVSYCVRCYMNPISISAHVLDKLHIPQYDPADPLHRRIAEICEAGHRTEADSMERSRLQEELDRAIGALYGIPDTSLTVIRAALESL